MFNKLFKKPRQVCNHEWELLAETTTKSKYEVAIELFKHDESPGAISMPHQLCDATRKHIQYFSCKKCGELKQFVEEI